MVYSLVDHPHTFDMNEVDDKLPICPEKKAFWQSIVQVDKRSVYQHHPARVVCFAVVAAGFEIANILQLNQLTLRTAIQQHFVFEGKRC